MQPALMIIARAFVAYDRSREAGAYADLSTDKKDGYESGMMAAMHALTLDGTEVGMALSIAFAEKETLET